MPTHLAGETKNDGSSSAITNEVTITQIGDKGYLDVNAAGSMIITNALNFLAFDLNAAAFSKTTDVSNDFVLDSVLLNFSTTESKTITITGADGTILLGGTLDTSSKNKLRNTTVQNFNLGFGTGFDGGDNITVAVTQFSSAGTMDCILKVRQGDATGLTGAPVLGAGDEIIGRVKVTDGTDVLDVVGDGDSAVVENAEGVTTTKLLPIAGFGNEGKVRFVRVLDNGRMHVENLEQRSLLQQILLELRLIRTHQESITDEEIKETDIGR